LLHWQLVTVHFFLSLHLLVSRCTVDNKLMMMMMIDDIVHSGVDLFQVPLKLVLPSIFDTSLSSLNECDILGFQNYSDPPTYFQGSRPPTPISTPLKT